MRNGVGGGLLDYDATWEGHDASYHAAFRNNSMSNVSAQATWNAFLPCKITDLGQDTLTWIRQGDFTILTSGRTRYTSDDRFIAHHNESLGTWTLQIKYVQPKDAGTYECQVGAPIASSFLCSVS
ncbi:unnamed protein product [Darwinula stevensoni]|uniref:Ig-like domain-containing protein n=1 Tax=Darwinula stevensoni TaxID=69355 RepID=A0A7R9FS36_9CRUS|nr:unnamed protein product [Darwinula stevensoni]CAG0902495.1 unnamed protein product [Darwinula stevensoni]